MLGKKIKYIGGYVIGGFDLVPNVTYTIVDENWNGDVTIKIFMSSLLILKREVENCFEVVE